MRTKKYSNADRQGLAREMRQREFDYAPPRPFKKPFTLHSAEETFRKIDEVVGQLDFLFIYNAGGTLEDDSD